MKNLILFLSFVFLFAAQVQAQDETTKRKKQFNLSSGLAAEGYDVVAYFTLKKAVKGDKAYQHTHQGVKYNFSSQKNLDTFKANPTKYEPAYGGWCAYAMGANGEKVDINPQTFKIMEGKLYLFYNAYFNNTLNSWNKDETNLKKKADSNWQKTYK